MEKIMIRRGEIADAAVLAAFAAHTFAEAYGADTHPADVEAHVEAFYGAPQQAEELADPEVRTLLAYRNDELIGFAQVRSKGVPACVAADSPVELCRFYLVRAAHGTGAAQALMRAAHRAARELGGRHLWLGVWERNQRAIAFYKKSGFKQVGQQEFPVGSDIQKDWVFITPLPLEEAADLLRCEHEVGRRVQGKVT